MKAPGTLLMVLWAFPSFMEVFVATNLFVGNLSFQMTNADLEELFSQAGSVTSANIIMDRDTGRSRGFGFVEMGSEDESSRPRPNGQRGQAPRAPWRWRRSALVILVI